MKNKLVNGILIVLGSIVLLLMAFPFGMIFATAFWIYLGVLVFKRKRIFHEELKPQLAKKQLKRLKTMSFVAGISFIIAVVGILMHNVRSGISESEESLYFYIGTVTLYVFILATAIGIFIFLKSRQKPI